MGVVSKVARHVLYVMHRKAVTDAVLDSACSAVVSYYEMRDVPASVKSAVPDVLRVVGAYGQKPGQQRVVPFVQKYLAAV